MKRYGISATTAALALALAVPAVAAQESYELAGERVAVHNLAGSVEVVRGSGSAVRVTVQRGGDDASRLRVEVDPIDGRNVLRVIYPSDEIVYTGLGRGRYNSQVSVRSDGRLGGGGDRVRVRSEGSGLRAHADLRIEVPAGRDLAVHLAIGEVTSRGVSGDLAFDIGSGRVDAEGTTGTLFIDTGSGNVRVADSEGDVTVDTGSGGVEITNVRGERVLVDTGSGTVTARSVTAERVTIDTGSGGVRVSELAATDVELDTGSGSIEAALTRPVERLLVDTGSGGVTLELPDGIDATVELETGSGSIDVDLPLEVRTMRRDHVTGRLGSGRGLIEVDTGSGSIRLRRR